MADAADLKVTFGVDTASLTQGLAEAKAQLGAFANVTRSNFAQAAGAVTPIAGAAKNSAAEMIAEAQRVAEGEIKAAELAQQTLKAQLDLEVAQRKISQGQEEQELAAGLARQYQAEVAALQKELDLQNLKPAQIQAINNKIEEMEAQHQIKLLQLQTKTLQENETAWQNALGTIENAFNSQLRGLLAGTTSWQQAMEKILGDLIIKAIEGLESWVVQHAAAMLANTAATQTSATAQVAAQQSVGAAGALAGAQSMLQTIAAGVGATIAGVTGWLAPLIGPAAPAAGAAAGATVAATATAALAAVPALDVGGYVLSDGLAMIHAGETIQPASVATPYGGGAGNVDRSQAVNVSSPVNIHIAAHDAQSVADFFHNNSKVMLRAINNAVKNGAHLGLRALRPQ